MNHGNGSNRLRPPNDDYWRNYWVELPDSGGREQAGRRPAIILQNDMYAASLPTVLVVPLSSAIAALRFPGTALI
jgi:hypothetical protein